VTENFLPVRKQVVEDEPEKKKTIHQFYIEPDRDTMRADLLPRFLRIQLYRILLDSNASEHAARMLAMQTATDNADDLLVELTLDYNKTRQQAITAELLDIIGGSFR
jgi:F-type H+-transporting ATPase subunit gamma